MSDDIQKKIDELEAEMARTQKNKATNYHLGTLKAKIAKLKVRRSSFGESEFDSPWYLIIFYLVGIGEWPWREIGWKQRCRTRL